MGRTLWCCGGCSGEGLVGATEHSFLWFPRARAIQSSSHPKASNHQHRRECSDPREQRTSSGFQDPTDSLEKLIRISAVRCNSEMGFLPIISHSSNSEVSPRNSTEALPGRSCLKSPQSIKTLSPSPKSKLDWIYFHGHSSFDNYSLGQPL